MAWVDLQPNEQELTKQFTRDYRAAMADTVRGLRMQELLASQFVNSIADLWAQINSDEVIPDGTGLSGADTTLTKAEFNSIFNWSQNLLSAVYSDDGGSVPTDWQDKETVDGYGVQLAGPTNI